VAKKAAVASVADSVVATDVAEKRGKKAMLSVVVDSW
jgi:hypothetical protein